MKDADIREGLKRKVLRPYIEDDETLVIDEVGLRHGAARVDILVVNGYLHGYELKGEKDTLRRLSNQIRIYASVLDYVTMVVSENHLENTERIVPDWWGVRVARKGKRGGISFPEIRRPRRNPSPDPVAIAKLLWREEALVCLHEMGKSKGLLSKPRKVLYARLAEALELDSLRARVRRQLRSRTAWRSGGQQMSGGG